MPLNAPSAQARYLLNQNLLNSCGTPLEPLQFYRSIFPTNSFERAQPKLDGLSREQRTSFYQNLDTSERYPNGLLLELPQGCPKAKVHMVFDDLSAIETFFDSPRFGLMAPIGYSGRKRDLAHSYTLYAMAFDVDEPHVDNIIYQARRHIIPCPTFIVLSGHGVHLYYQFEDPIPMYPVNRHAMNLLKHHLTKYVWTHYTSDIKHPQYQSINQGFRVVGGCSKLGLDYPVRAWRFGSVVTLDYMMDFLDEHERSDVGRVICSEDRVTLAQAKNLWPDWYRRRVEKQEVSKSWHIKRDLYDWWLKKIQSSSSLGHRYFCVMALAIYARKCDIDRDELEHDAYGLVPLLDSISPEDNPFTRDDVKAALKAYDDRYATFTRDAISSLTAIKMVPNRRNYRKRSEHLKRARFSRDLNNPSGWGNMKGRPCGPSEDKYQSVIDYVKLHPQAGPTAISRATGVSRSTIYRYLPERAGERKPRGRSGGRTAKRKMVLEYLASPDADRTITGIMLACEVSRPTAVKYMDEWGNGGAGTGKE